MANENEQTEPDDDTGDRPSYEEIIELEVLPKTVREMMTAKVITVTEDETLLAAEQGMEKFRFRHLPVVEGRKLVGLVTHADILHAHSSWLSDLAEERDRIIMAQPVKRIMQREIVTIGPDESLLDAAKVMWEARLGCLPVVDSVGRLLGIVTEGDFIRLTIRLLVHGKLPPPPSAARGSS